MSPTALLPVTVVAAEDAALVAMFLSSPPSWALALFTMRAIKANANNFFIMYQFKSSLSCFFTLDIAEGKGFISSVPQYFL